MWLEIILLVVILAVTYQYLFGSRPRPVPNTKNAKNSASSSSSTGSSANINVTGTTPGSSTTVTSPKPSATPVVTPPATNFDIKIFYGSQTGTAETFSFTLKDEAAKLGMTADVIDIEKYTDHSALAKEKATLIFAVATYGEGEPTDNSKSFYHWITDPDNTISLAGVKFTVFGLGNKTYENYNAIGRGLDKRLAELGAERVFERGEGDDDANLEEDFKKWKKRMWPVLVTLIKGSSAENTEISEEDNVHTCRVTIERLSGVATTEDKLRFSQAKLSQHKDSFDVKVPYFATISENRELHTNLSDRSCRHIEISLDTASHPSLAYEPGDHLGVYPRNSPALVASLLARIGEANPNQLVKVITSGSGETIGPITLEALFLYYLDITNPPRASVLKVLASYANEKEQAKLLHYSTEAGQQDYIKEIKQPMVTILEILERFPSVKPPLDVLVDILPRLTPRYYSISSSLRAKANSVSVTVGVLSFTTSTGRLHEGVCSTWLSPLESSTPVPVFIRKSQFRLPPNPATPIIMVGPGTGLAPFRSFIQERANLPQSGQNVLFFGCRNRAQDFIYEEELKQFEGQSKLMTFTAFSRDSDKKVYVQHRIAENWELVARLIDKEGAYVYVCGDARQMPADVQKAIVESLIKSGKPSNAADALIHQMIKDGRYQQDVWF